MFTDFPLLSLLLWSPFVGALVLALIPSNMAGVMRLISFGIALFNAVVAYVIFREFDPTVTGYQFVERIPWIESWGVAYHLGIDGISLLLVLLSAALLPILVLFLQLQSTLRFKAFVISVMLLQFGVLGSFLSVDVLLFYVFWELMLIPMFFIIGIWGGGRRVYAAMKLFLYTLLGSVLMLTALLVLYFGYAAQTGNYTTNLTLLYDTVLPVKTQLWLFAAFSLAFAIKVPMFPLHTWLPDAHVEAPTVGSVILAAVLLKMGTYGFMRFAYPLFPDAAMILTPVIAILAVIGIVYGALVAMAQNDIKKLVAYSSVSHLGYVMLGVCALTVTSSAGALLQMVNHGISTGLLFLLVGMIYERRHTRNISDFGGIARIMPRYTFCFMVATFASIGLPGTNGFVGEFMIMLGSFNSPYLASSFKTPWAGYLLVGMSVLGVILGAIYMLSLVQKVFFGPIVHDKNRLMRDASIREVLVLSPLLIAVFVIGIYPNLLLGKIETSVKSFVQSVKPRFEEVSSHFWDQ